MKGLDSLLASGEGYHLDVPGGTDKPYASPKGFFVRNGANSQKLDRNEIIQFCQKEGRVFFDELENEKAEFESDFDSQVFEEFVRSAGISRIMDTKSLLINMNCLTPKGKFTNTGVLFFSKSIDFLMSHAVVTCVLYKGIEKLHILDKKDFKENLVANIHNAISFVQRHTNEEYKIEKVGTGINRIQNSVKENGHLSLEFYYDDTFFTVTFFRNRTNGELNGELNPTLRELMSYIATHPGIMATTLSDKLNRSYKTLEKQIQKLLNGGYIERRGSRKTGGYYPKENP